MGARPPVHCPLCNDEVDPAKDIDDHLVENHSKEELASSISSELESREDGDNSQ